MPRPRTCKPPRTVTVRGHWRQVRKTRKKKRAPRRDPRATLAVVDSRNGRVISRHRTFTAAVQARRRADRAAWRRGEGRPYDVKKAA